MALYAAFLKAVGKAALNAIGGGVAGDVICDVLPEVAAKVCNWWGAGRSPQERQAELAALAAATPDEASEAVRVAVAEVAGDQPPQVQKRLSLYLSLTPGAVRASMRRAGPGPLGLPLESPIDLVPLLPAHLPRFQAGDRPLPGIDWELVELLGSGGFGEVWKARNPHFDAVPPVALKFCLDPTARDRLLRHEAAVLNQVMRQGRHPGIVHLRQTYLSADPPCLEYEFISGGDLSGLIQQWRQSSPGVECIRQHIYQLAEIVAFAHCLTPPIVHRDLKPANILIEPRPDGTSMLRVADFGIGGVAVVRAVAASARGLSQGAYLVTALRGSHTPLYASPQQARGDAPDPRDDIYSLGVIWHQMLTGDLLSGRPGGTRWTGRLAAAGVPSAQINLLSACLEDDPADRPADAREFAIQLAALAPAPKAGAVHHPQPAPTSTPVPPAKPVPAPPLLPTPALVPTGATATDFPVTEKCPDCGGAVKVRFNKVGGGFLGCASFPSCRGTRRPSPELAERLRALRDGTILPPPAPVAAPEIIPLLHYPSSLINSLGMRFVLIPAGTFWMGSPVDEAMRNDDEGNPRVVRVPRPFYLGQGPVRQKEYEGVQKSNPSHFHRKNGGSAEHPVEQVSWDDAVAFCRNLSSLAEEKNAGRVYRLPAENEWEYACRAGTSTPFAFGAALTSSQANFDGTKPYGGAAPSVFRQATTRVASFAANAWGLYDMHGNVWEWCADWYTTATHRVVRGGSWNNSGHLCRSARRQKYAPGFRGDNVGFRLALDLTAG